MQESQELRKLKYRKVKMQEIRNVGKVEMQESRNEGKQERKIKVNRKLGKQKDMKVEMKDNRNVGKQNCRKVGKQTF